MHMCCKGRSVFVDIRINKYLASGIKNVPEKFAVGRVGQESITGNDNFSNNSVVSAYFISNLLRGMGTFK